MDSPYTQRQFQPFIMLFVFFGLMIVSLYFCVEIVKWTLPLFFVIADATSFLTNVKEQIANPDAALYYQSMASAIGMFILPTLFYHLIFRVNMIETMGLCLPPSITSWAMSIAIMLLASFFIQIFVQFSQAIPLPEHWAFLRNGQQQVEQLIDSFFNNISFVHIVWVSLVLAVLPAVGEELCFRGTIQNLLAKTNLGNKGAIIVTGFTFALMHLEFDNFLSIWVMGIVLGLLYYYTGSIWVSILAHFCNNMLMVLLKYAYHRGLLAIDFGGSEMLPLYLALPAGVVMVGGLMTLSKLSGRASSLSVD